MENRKNKLKIKFSENQKIQMETQNTVRKPGHQIRVQTNDLDL